MKKFMKQMQEKGLLVKGAAVIAFVFGVVIFAFIAQKSIPVGAGLQLPASEKKGLQKASTPAPSVMAVPDKAEETDGAKQQVKGASAKELEKDETVHLGFAGDICLDDTCAVMRHMKEKGGFSKVISKKLVQKMRGYDCMVINNEFSVSKRGAPMEGKAYTFRSHPSNLKYLKYLGVDVVGLANNHIYDYGEDAFLDTLKYLKNAGFQTVGAGKNKKEAKEPVYLTMKNKKIAIVAATRAEKYILTPEAGKNSPGVFRTYQDKAYVKEIKKAAKKADYVIAYVHWGTEYSTDLEDAQKTQARDYINAGADVVVGAHTHCLQGMEWYKGVPIFYSLGNFWFNEWTLYTTVLEIDITKEGRLSAKMLPCLQKGKETRLLTKKKQKQKFANYVNSISVNGRLDEEGNVHKK